MHNYACNSFSLFTVLVSLSHLKYVCTQCLLKINYVSYYLSIAYLDKLSDWSFDRSDCFSSCFCLSMEFYNVFELRKVFFCGDSAFFAGSFDILLNLDDASIILTSTRFNAALIFSLFVAGYLHVCIHCKNYVILTTNLYLTWMDYYGI